MLALFSSVVFNEVSKLTFLNGPLTSPSSLFSIDLTIMSFYLLHLGVKLLGGSIVWMTQRAGDNMCISAVLLIYFQGYELVVIVAILFILRAEEDTPVCSEENFVYWFLPAVHKDLANGYFKDFQAYLSLVGILLKTQCHD